MINLPFSVSDDPLGANQYRYLREHAWLMVSFDNNQRFYRYLSECLDQQWIPAIDLGRDWSLERSQSGRRIWLIGSQKAAIADGFDVTDRRPVGRWRAPYGDYFAAAKGQPPSHRDGNWQRPTFAFLDQLPRDPHKLLERLQTSSPPDRPSYLGPATYALDALRSGLVPAELRAALYRALLLLPQVTAVDSVANPDGAASYALVVDHQPTRTEIFIDQNNGQYSGERTTVTANNPAGLEIGTVLGTRATIIRAVDEIGAVPDTV
ncbi:MAG TPA: hypothetical protein VF444_01230 [Pseudonocardiaceae bacterium]